MKNILKSVCALAFFFFVIGCSEDQINLNSKLEELSPLESSVSARSFVESNEELKVQIDATNPVFVASLSDIEIAKLKAALYRFYSTVEVKEDKYYTPLENAKEINLSKELFKLFEDNLSEMNRNIDELKDKEGGNEFVVQQVAPEYLESLLK